MKSNTSPDAIMGKSAAIVQSAYIPWKGFFELIHDVDVFVFFDSVQYQKRRYVNRNRIKSPLGTRWITVPVHASTKFTIYETEIAEGNWIETHLTSLLQSYKSSPFWSIVNKFIESMRELEPRTISELNQHIIREICEWMGITTELICSSDIPQHGQKSELLISILKHLGADNYISGPAAKSYITDEFEQAGIELRWKNYDGYPEYEQPHGPFEHEVSVLDLIASRGLESQEYIWGWRDEYTPSHSTNM